MYCYLWLSIQLNMSFVYSQLNDQTVLFQTIQFSQSHLFALSLNFRVLSMGIWQINRNLSGATTLGQSGPGSDSIKGVLHIPQCSNITIVLFNVISKTLIAEMQSVYFTASAVNSWERQVKTNKTSILMRQVKSNVNTFETYFVNSRIVILKKEIHRSD